MHTFCLYHIKIHFFFNLLVSNASVIRLIASKMLSGGKAVEVNIRGNFMSGLF